MKLSLVGEIHCELVVPKNINSLVMALSLLIKLAEGDNYIDLSKRNKIFKPSSKL